MYLLPSFDFTGQLQNRIYTVFASLSLTAIVFVILTSQVGLYFCKSPINGRSRDPLWVKGIVIFIWLMQVLECALACHMTVLAHTNDSPLDEELARQSLWEWAIYTWTSTSTQCLVHAFFITRIYLLEISPGRIRTSMMLCIPLILEGSFGFISMLQYMISNPHHIILSWIAPVWLGFSILADVSIAISICYVLKKGSPFASLRLHLLVQRLTKFCIQTGLITSLVTGITVALWTVTQLDLGHLTMSFPMGGIYATCLMANLIARDSYFHHIQIDEGNEHFGMVTRSIVFATPEGSDKDESTSSEAN